MLIELNIKTKPNVPYAWGICFAVDVFGCRQKQGLFRILTIVNTKKKRRLIIKDNKRKLTVMSMIRVYGRQS